MPPRPANVIPLLVVAGFFAYVVLTFRAQLRGTAIPADQVFETLIAQPIPDEVTDLQGVRADSMQGYVAFLRFRAPSLAAAGLAGPHYRPVACQEIRPYFQLPGFIASPFSPPWSMPAASELCVEASELPHGVHNRVAYTGGWIHFTSSAD